MYIDRSGARIYDEVPGENQDFDAEDASSLDRIVIDALLAYGPTEFHGPNLPA